MVIRRISFIEAGSPSLHIFSKFPIPRLGAVLLSTILRAMGLFYSWRYIFRHPARLDFHYAAIGLFGKTAVHKFLKASSAYLADHGFNTG